MEFLLEIGTEELPSTDVLSALDQLRGRIPHIFAAQRIILSENSLKFYGTPRRLVVSVEVGSSPSPEAVVSIIKSLRFEKTMRWLPRSGVSFSRPIRWILALCGSDVISLRYAGVESGNFTFGPRFLGSPKVFVSSSGNYFDSLRENFVILDQNERRNLIKEKAWKLAEEVGGKVVLEDDLLDEVTQLTENPLVLRGSFDQRFLAIPREVVATVIKKHQRYFPVENESGALLPYFITVANQLPKNSAEIVEGNNKVVTARLTDGEFFYSIDRRQKLEHFVSELKAITFHELLGSVYEKSERIEKLAPALVDYFGMKDDLKDKVLRAAHLCKADLATSLVREFSSLQGVIGKIYALEDGEDQSVAEAIFEHYLPRFAGDDLARSDAGIILSLADKLDTLAGFFAVGVTATGSTDPYALRRAALGMVQVLSKIGRASSLLELTDLGGRFLPVGFEEREREAMLQFVKERIRVDFKEKGLSEGVIRSVLLGPKSDDVFAVYSVSRSLSERSIRPEFRDFLRAAARAHNIVKNVEVNSAVDEKLFTEAAEKELFDDFLRSKDRVEEALRKDDTGKVLESYESLSGPINRFFEEILVMSDDPKIRQNRLTLLSQIDSLTNLLFVPSELNF